MAVAVECDTTILGWLFAAIGVVCCVLAETSDADDRDRRLLRALGLVAFTVGLAVLVLRNVG